MAKVVLGAGGLVFNQLGEVLLIRDHQGYWVFPKGHLEPGESLEATALREVYEETGIKAEIKGVLGSTEYMNAKGIKRQIHWFLMQGQGEIALELGLSGAGFFSKEEAKDLLSFTQDLPLFAEALSKFEEIKPLT